MNFDLSDEQKMFAESAARYVRERSNIEDKRKSSASNEGFSSQHWSQFAEMGWLALTLPERVDGLECEIADLTVLMEQIGRGVFHEPLIDTAVLSASLLSNAGNNALAETVLRGIGAGEQIVSLAHIEGDERCECSTDLNRLATTATKTSNGWTLNGSKQRVFHAPAANQFLVSAQADGQAALFCVAADATGISQQSYQLIDGSHAGDITFNNVEVSADALLLNGSDLQAALEIAFDKATLADCARALGSMELVMEITADYLKTRVQYGKPLAQFQALQHRMAEMLVEYEQSQSILYRALSLFDDANTRHAGVSAAKVLISKAARWVTGQCIQLHGGIGVTEEYMVGHHYKAMLTFEQRFGDSNWHLDQCDSLIDHN